MDRTEGTAAHIPSEGNAAPRRRLVGDSRVLLRPTRNAVGGTILVLVSLLAVWEAATRLFAVPTFLLPPPSLVITEGWGSLPALWNHGLVTLSEILVGFGIALVGGILVATSLYWFKLLHRIVWPIVLLLQTTPKVALVPMLIVWVGTGLPSKVILVVLISFFPILIGMTAGLRSVDEKILMLARTAHAKRRDLFFKIQLPHSLPQLFSGIKVSITLALIGAIVAEFVASRAGLGYFMLLAFGRLKTSLVLAIVLAITIMGQVLYLAVVSVERIAIPWHVSQRGDGGKS